MPTLHTHAKFNSVALTSASTPRSYEQEIYTVDNGYSDNAGGIDITAKLSL